MPGLVLKEMMNSIDSFIDAYNGGIPANPLVLNEWISVHKAGTVGMVVKKIVFSSNLFNYSPSKGRNFNLFDIRVKAHG